MVGLVVCSDLLDVDDALVLSCHTACPFPCLFIQTVFLCCSTFSLQLHPLLTHTHFNQSDQVTLEILTTARHMIRVEKSTERKAKHL